MATTSRSNRRSRRAEKRRQSQQRLIIGAVLLGIVALIGVIVLNAGNRSVDTGPADEAATRYAGLSQSVSDTGATGYALGDDAAPVTIVEYSDFSCPHCADLADIMHQIIVDYVRDGDVQLIYKPVAIINPPYSVSAAEAAICAGEQGAFWEMHDLLWTIHRENSPAAFVPRMLNVLPAAIELDANRYQNCMQSTTVADILAATETELRQTAQRAGMTSVGTPTILLNDTLVGYTGADSFYDMLRIQIELALDN